MKTIVHVMRARPTCIKLAPINRLVTDQLSDLLLTPSAAADAKAGRIADVDGAFLHV